MSIEAMRQALEALEQINQLSIGENAIALPGEIDGAMDNLRAAIEQAEKPVAWMYVNTDGECEEIEYGQCEFDDPSIQLLYTAPRQEQPLKIDPAGCHIRVGEVSEPISVGYDQTSLELCEDCGWKAVIPGDGCLVCARQKAKPVWIPRNHLEHAQREPSMCRVEPTKRLPDFVPLYPAPRQWVGLTDEEINDEWDRVTGHSILGGNRSDGRTMFLSPDEVVYYTQAIETKLKEKNNVLRSV
jgi:hypothetical protein